MKALVFVGGLDATFKARIRPLAKMLGSFGIYCDFIKPINWECIARGKIANILSVALTYSIKGCNAFSNLYDVAIIGRVSNLQAHLLVRGIKHKGVKVMFDLDDALFLPVGKLFGIDVRPGSFFLEKILSEADHVTVNGHFLYKYARHFNENVSIIHDPVDCELFNPKRKKKISDKITITWEGNARVNFENLYMLIRPLKRVAVEYKQKIKFKIVSSLGDQRIKRVFNPLEKLMEIDYGSEAWLPMEKFAEMLYDSDIMVAPLKNDLWYEGKSALRVGIGMALGVPVIASPVGEQKYVIKHGVNGFLARNEDEWYNYLRVLIEDDNLRRRMGKEGRKTAEKELSLEVNGKKLYKIIKSYH